MLLGRFFTVIPVLAIAGSLAAKKHVPESLGTFPVNGPLFTDSADLGNRDRRRFDFLPRSQSRPNS